MRSSIDHFRCVLGILSVMGVSPAFAQPSGSEIYSARCVTCHGAGGNPRLAARTPATQPFDFTRCSVASAEPDAAWLIAISEGGPAVGLSAEMPAFGRSLSADRIREVVDYLRGLCLDEGWPNGNLNLPRPILTEKAFPEDEIVVLPAVSHRRHEPGEGAIETVIEKRFGKRNNVEIAFPFATVDAGFGRQSGSGDIKVSLKRVLSSDRPGTRILSAGIEIAFPTGSESKGLGEGTTRFEPFLAAGLARGRSSLQAAVTLELPKAGVWNSRAFEYNVYAGRDLDTDSKRWTIGLELNGENRELALTPQIRKALVKTGALAAAFGVQVPVTKRDEQHTRVVGYLLWEYREPIGRRR